MKRETLREAGFSLIETLVAMSILGVVSGISLTVFSTYQTDAYNSQALNQLKAIVAAEEAYFSNADSYISCETADCPAVLQGVVRTSGVKVQANGAEETFSVAACNNKGNLHYTWSSIDATIHTTPIVPGECDPEAPPVL